jgi:hypothetical protein
MASTNPAITLPPMGSSSRSTFGRSLTFAEIRDSLRTHQVANSSRIAAPTNRKAGGTSWARDAVTLDPTIAPSVAPAAMNPNSLLPCSELKISTTIDQKIETTKKLNTDIQINKKRPTQMV